MKPENQNAIERDKLGLLEYGRMERKLEFDLRFCDGKLGNEKTRQREE
jgi:hypothetical protein